MELYRKVRLACRDGMSERAAARHFGVSRQSVRKMLQFSVPPGYRRTAPVRRPKLDEFTALIEQWLGDDRRHGYRKQRHTAKRIFERLRDEHGFTGGYTIVKDYVREHRRHRREMFVPLTHPPGHAQADFGEAWAVIAGVKQKVHFFAFDLPQSDASYVRAYRAATAEAWVDGHVHAFSFFGAVALLRLCTTTTGVWCRALSATGRAVGARGCSADFSRTTSSGTGTGARARAMTRAQWRDRLVGWSRRNFMVPLPRFASLEALNGYLEQRCRERQGTTDVLRGHRERCIAKRLERDLEAMTALPGAPFDAVVCHQAAGQVSSQSLVRYHNNDYSVPVAYGYRQVWVRGYVDRVVIVGCGAEVGAGDRRGEIVRNHQLWDAVKEPQRPHVRGAPVRERLGPGGLGEGVVRRPEDGDEDLCFAQLPGGALDDGHALSGVVDEQLLAGAVGLAHHHVEALTPSAVALAELTVLQPLGVLGLVLVPQQREGDVLVAAFGVDLSPVRNGALNAGRYLRDGEQPRFERALVELLGQGPGQPGRVGAANVVAHR